MAFTLAKPVVPGTFLIYSDPPTMKCIHNYGNLNILLKGVIRYGQIHSRDYT